MVFMVHCFRWVFYRNLFISVNSWGELFESLRLRSSIVDFTIVAQIAGDFFELKALHCAFRLLPCIRSLNT